MENVSITLLSFAGNLVMLIAIVVIFWRRGIGTASKEVIEMREKQVAALKDEIQRLDTKLRDDRQNFNHEIKEMSGKIGELTGRLITREEENKKLTELLTNRNPEMNEFLSKLMLLMEKIELHLAKEQ